MILGPGDPVYDAIAPHVATLYSQRASASAEGRRAVAVEIPEGFPDEPCDVTEILGLPVRRAAVDAPRVVVADDLALLFCALCGGWEVARPTPTERRHVAAFGYAIRDHLGVCP